VSEHSQQMTLSLGAFIRAITARFDIIVIIIPVVFLALEHTGVTVVTNQVSDEIVRTISTFWPVLAQQYEEINRVSPGGASNNFAVACAATLVLDLALIIFVTIKYAERRDKITQDKYDIAIAAILITLGIYILLLDEVKEHPKPIWDFYVDPYGFYYFRQVIAAYGLWMIAAILGIVTFEAFNKLLKKSAAFKRSEK
jgi:hypothetical protein